MASTQDERLEEIVWRAPEIVQNMGGIHTNTVLFYFAESPFFERTSNNASLYAQALNNQSIFYIITERRFFEERLRSMQGLEYMVTQDPSEGDKKQVHSGVWVIRKQNRRKRTGLTDEVTPLANYFIVGESIYMAPSLGAILSTRLLSVLTSLSELHTTARSLPLFNPAAGHTYMPPSTSSSSKHSATTPTSSFQTTNPSKSNTPIPGSTPQPATTDIPPSSSSSSMTTKPSKHDSASGGGSSGGDHHVNPTDARLLAESWHLAHEYGNDYMDDNPIIGEPGSFKLSKSRDFSLSVSRSSNNTNTTSGGTPAPPSSQPFSSAAKVKKAGTGTAPTIQTKDLPPMKEKERKGTATPGTGTGKTPTSAEGAGFKDRKGRRKSKAAGAGVVTPKEKGEKGEKEKEVQTPS